MTTPTAPVHHLDRDRYRTRDEMIGGARRQLRALPEYAAQTGEVPLSDFQDLVREAEAALTQTVVTLVLEQSWTWAMVGSELGITRAAARNRFGPRVDLARALAAAQTDPQ